MVGEVDPLTVNVPLLVTLQAPPPSVELAPETVTPALPLIVALPPDPQVKLFVIVSNRVPMARVALFATTTLTAVWAAEKDVLPDAFTVKVPHVVIAVV